MILSNALFSLKQIITKPYFLLPIIIVLLVSAVVTSFGSFALERPAIDYILYYDSLPNDDLLGHLIFNYPVEILTMLVLGVIMSIITLIGMISVARLANGEKFSDAINDTIKNWKNYASLTVIFILALIIFGVVLGIIGYLGTINGLLLEIAMSIVLIITAIILVKVVFVIPALIEDNAKEAIQNSWQYTQKRFWRTLALVIVTLIISGIGVLLLQQIGIMLGEVLELPFFILAQAFGTTYFVASITNYFNTKRK